MKKSLMITLLIVVGATVVPWSAVAQDCQYHHSKLDFRTLVLIDTIEPYDRCREAKMVGTLNGRYWYCFSYEEQITSDFIYGDDFDRIFAGHYYSWIETELGDLEFIEWTWGDQDFSLEAGIARVIGGTGAFEGAVGSLSWLVQDFPNRPSHMAEVEGYICTP